MKKIIFFKFIPITSKVYKDICIEQLLCNGFQVEYWQINEILNTKFSNFKSFTPPKEMVIRKISTYDQFEILVSKNTNACYISLMTCNFRQIKLLKIITKYKCKLGIWGMAPIPYNSWNWKDLIKMISFKNFIDRMMRYYMFSLFHIGIIKRFDFMLTIGNMGYMELGLGKPSGYILKNTIEMPLNSPDYNYNLYYDNNITKNEEYIVFLDEYYPLHPDNEILGFPKYPVDEYYDCLNNVFSAFENYFGINVIIAAHPKALQYEEKDYFKGRKTMFNSTGDLVKNAKLVLGHNSTSIGFAVMNHKPIVLLSSEWIKSNRPLTQHFIESFSAQLSIPVIMMDNHVTKDLSKLNIRLTKEQYQLQENYINKYCTSSTINVSNEQLIPKYFIRIFSL